MARDPHAVDAKSYNSLVSRAGLRSIRLTGTKFMLKPEALLVASDQWRKDIGVEVGDVVLDEASSLLAGTFAFEVVCRHRRKRIVAVQATYIVAFRLQGTYDHETAALFLERVGRVAAYPYFRSLVADLLSQAGVQMPPLPIISLAPRTVSSVKDLDEHLPVQVLPERSVKSTSKSKSKKDPTD